MGESGGDGGESDGSVSDAADSAFEFGDVLDDETDVSEVVDFSGGDDSPAEADDGDPDSDAADPPDEPDPDDDPAGSEVTEPSGSSAVSGSGSGAGSSSDSSGDVAASSTSSSSNTAASAGSEPGDAESGSDGGAGDGTDVDEPDPDDPDSDDPPDTQGDSGRFYDIDPVEESRQAFDFAESQSKAAYEFAYRGATRNPLARLILKYTSPEVRERVDEVFSRRMLGSVLVGGAFSKILETSVELYFGAASVWRPVMWAIIFVIATLAFVWWDHLAQKATEAAESAAKSASEAAESAAKSASEAAESATQKAEQASEAASRAAEAATDATGEGAQGNPDEGDSDLGPSTLNEAGQMTASLAGGERPASQRTRRRRAPNRRPNKRFSAGPDADERRLGDGAKFELVDRAELTDGGGSSFKDPGDADEL